MKLFEKLPHVGGVMTLEEDKLIKQFIRFLFRVMEERKLQFEKELSEVLLTISQKGAKCQEL